MKTFVVGDIHGNYKALVQCIERSNFDPTRDRLITLGDYVDGGEHIEVLEVFTYLLSLPNWIGIMGNHDEFLYQTIKEGWNIVNPEWYLMGGRNTLNSLKVDVEISGEFAHIKSPLLPIINKFVSSLLLLYVDDNNNAYVHAGWSSPHQRIDESDSVTSEYYFDLMWSRSFWSKANENEESPHKRVFIGHTANPNNPEKRNNIWNIDSGAGFEGCLTIMDVESEESWQSDRTKELYSNYTKR